MANCNTSSTVLAGVSTRQNPMLSPLAPGSEGHLPAPGQHRKGFFHCSHLIVYDGSGHRSSDAAFRQGTGALLLQRSAPAGFVHGAAAAAWCEQEVGSGFAAGSQRSPWAPPPHTPAQGLGWPVAACLPACLPGMRLYESARVAGWSCGVRGYLCFCVPCCALYTTFAIGRRAT